MDNQIPSFYRKPKGKKINQVFTPRNNEVNHDMYVSRPDLEKDLMRALSGSKHIVIYGESGGGKTWLYKKHFSDNDIYIAVVNMANASRFGSISKELKNLANSFIEKSVKKITETKEASLNAVISKGKLSHSKEYDIFDKEPLELCFEKISEKANDKKAVLVFENLERIFPSKKMMDELGDVITLLDDDRYAKFNIKIVIVGVPAGIKEYFSKTSYLQTVANRLEEISEVSRLGESQVHLFVVKGFNQVMKANINYEILTHWAKHIYNRTLGIPQKVHEYCEHLAYAFEDNTWIATKELTDIADNKWLEKGLAEAYSVVATAFPKRKTKKDRRSQILYCLSKIDKHLFNSKDVEDLMNEHFPSTLSVKNLPISATLRLLTKDATNLLRRSIIENAYCFTDPRFLSCLRLMLVKDDKSESISVVDVYRKKYGYNIKQDWGRK